MLLKFGDMKKLEDDEKAHQERGGFSMLVAVPREIMMNEGRVGATPEIVKKMDEDGMNVLVEKGAGMRCFFRDDDYAAAGAKIMEDVEELYAQAEVVIKVKEPMVNDEKGKHEIEMMRKGGYLICFLHPGNPANKEMIQLLAKRNITSFTLDSIPRITRAQSMDALTSMSTISGYKSVIMAANMFPKLLPMITTAVGVIKPAKVLVVGGGIVGLQAIATAKRLGAIIEAIDIRKDAQEQISSASFSDLHSIFFFTRTYLGTFEMIPLKFFFCSANSSSISAIPAKLSRLNPT